MRLRPRPYQEVAVAEVLRRHQAGRRKMLLHLPTGSGKTVIATLILERLLRRGEGPPRALVIAHRREILDQTARTIRGHLRGLRVGVEQGARRAGADADVVVASVQSLVRRKERFDPSAFGLIICDECHHALAPTWSEILSYFQDRRHPGALLLGMTATPRRSDGRSVAGVFDEVAYEISRAELQDLGYLATMRYFSVKADLKLDRVKLGAGDYQVRSLSAVMNSLPVRQLTLQAWQERGRGQKTLAFCAGVDHARRLAADLQGLGFRATTVDARTPDRGAILQRFREGELDMLLNYGVLTEGFDEPSIECILMARPTTSPLVYSQCVGRGLRPAPRKTTCTVIDIVDRAAHPLQYSAADLAGLPRGWRSGGRDPFAERRSLAGVRVTTSEAFLQISKASCLEAVQQVLMELPAGVVMAGLDGEAVLRYEPPAEQPPAGEAVRAAQALLREAGARWRRVRIDDEQDVLRVELVSPATSNERFAYLIWHLERVSRRAVVFAKPRTRTVNPRAVLRSMLREGARLSSFSVDDAAGIARATVDGLEPADTTFVCDRFGSTTGLTLELGGQLSLGLF